MWSEVREYPSFVDAIFLVLLFIACQFVAGYFFGMVAWGTSRVITNVAGGIVNGLAFLAAMQFVFFRSGGDYSQTVGTQRFSSSSLPAVLLGVLGSSILISELDGILEQALPVSGALKYWNDLFGNPKDLVGAILTLCVVAPITEEILFRGVILNGFLRNYRKLEALLLSSWLFAFMHLNPWQYAGAFLLGLLLGFLFIRTQSIIPSIICHSLFNATSVVGRRISHLPDIAIPFPWLTFNVIAVVLVATSIVLLLRVTKRTTFK